MVIETNKLLIEDIAIKIKHDYEFFGNDYVKQYLEYTESDEFIKKINLNKYICLNNDIFFVWIGTLDILNFEYLKVWEHCSSNITIWVDSRTKLYGLHRYILEEISKVRNKSLIEVQNDFYLFCEEHDKLSFDEALEVYALSFRKSFSKILEVQKSKFNSTFSYLSLRYKIKDVSKDLELEHFNNYYKLEIILRGNLCAASDIIRLKILYTFGGIYVDVDTLPYLSQNESKKILDIKKEVNGNLVDIILSNLIIQKHFNIHIISNNLSDKASLIEKYFDSVDKGINKEILRFVNEWSMDKLSFQKIYCHQNGIKISNNANNIQEFNNNIISSVPHSKLLRIILKELDRRYKYIIKRGYTQVHPKIVSRKIEYYERLRNYRMDGIEDEYVTLILSGPTLILETVLGCAYKVFDVDVGAYELSLALRNSVFGIGISKQVMFTIEHINSNWMLKTTI